jgi:hypothetical protein
MLRFSTPLVISLFLGAAFASGSALGAPKGSIATVTIAGVHYTLPQHGLGLREIERVELKPSNPLCHVYQYFYIAIIDRELFINGVLAYRARPGDRVVVSYGGGGDYWRHVRVNGHPAARQPEKTVEIPCLSLDNGEAIRIIRRPLAPQR